MNSSRTVFITLVIVGAAECLAIAACPDRTAVLIPSSGRLPQKSHLWLLLPVNYALDTPRIEVIQNGKKLEPSIRAIDTKQGGHRVYEIVIFAKPGDIRVEIPQGDERRSRDWHFTIDPKWKAPVEKVTTPVVSRVETDPQWAEQESSVRVLFAAQAQGYLVRTAPTHARLVNDADVVLTYLPRTPGMFFGRNTEKPVDLRLGRSDCFGVTYEFHGATWAEVRALVPNGTTPLVTPQIEIGKTGVKAP